MHVAILSDIHGNPIALHAVLEDIARLGGVDEVWVLGDLVVHGHAPVQVLRRLAELPNVRTVRGNTDRYVCTGERPPPSKEDVQADPSLLPELVEVAGTFAWTQGAPTNSGWLKWLGELPVELRTVLPDGTRVQYSHAGPGRDSGIGFQSGLSDAEFLLLLGECDADLAFVGHTHQFMGILVGGTRVVNVGSVSNPVPPDLGADYVVLAADASGYQIEHRQVEYDWEAVVTALESLRHPGAGFMVQQMRGLRVPTLERPGQVGT